MHKKDPIAKKSHSCKLDPGCEKVFSSNTSLKYHQLKAHGKAIHCEKCSKEFSNFKEFVKHRSSEKGNPEIPVVAKCSICKIPISSHHLKRHMRVVHEKPTKNPLKEPAEMHHCPDPLCCQKFKRVENMQRHVKDFHSLTNQVKWKCEQCEKSYTLERNLKLHTERVHAQFPFFSTFNCNQCEKSFKVKGNLTRHKKEQHSDGEVFSCPSCGKCFKRKSNQMSHSYTCKKQTKWGKINWSVIQQINDKQSNPLVWYYPEIYILTQDIFFLEIWRRSPNNHHVHQNICHVSHLSR